MTKLQSIPATTEAPRTRVARVTIGMPLYNDEIFVEDALRSILEQTFDDFILVISDNASTDSSMEIVHSVTGDDPRVRIVRRPENVGILANLNALSAGCETEYFMWAASDDIWHPSFLERMVDALDANPKAAIAFGTYTFIDEAGVPYGGHRNFDFKGGSVSERVGKLARMFDDGCFYGLYRMRYAHPLRVPAWHGPNRVTPYNTAYPMLFGVLARGDMAFVEGEPLWLNRIKKNPRHPVPDTAGRIRTKFIYALRQAELFGQSLLAIGQHSRSVIAPLRAVPPLARRFVRNLR